MLDRLGVDQPRWTEASSLRKWGSSRTRPASPLVRPSYVLSGAAMNMFPTGSWNASTLATKVSNSTVVVSEFVQEAKEMSWTPCQDGEIVAYAISEHRIRGRAFGDDHYLPPRKYILNGAPRKRISADRARLNISGRSISSSGEGQRHKGHRVQPAGLAQLPFVSRCEDKLYRAGLSHNARREVRAAGKSMFDLDYIGVKAPQFSFSRLHRADPVLGVEMASTGEVACLGENLYEAVLKAMLSVGYTIPEKNILISSGPPRSKIELLESAKLLREKGYNLFGTRGSAEFLSGHGVQCAALRWPDEKQKPDVLDYLREKKIDLVINIPKDLSHAELENDYLIRRAVVAYNIPLITNARLAAAFINAFCRLKIGDLSITSWDEYTV